MALIVGSAASGVGLAGLMAKKLKLIEPKFDPRIGGQQLDAIAQAVVEHFLANAQVTTTVTGAATGVTAGPAAAPVTGVGTGKIL